MGNEAPDFMAQAVFDQEFVEVTLSQYRVSAAWQYLTSYLVLRAHAVDSCMHACILVCAL